MNLYILRNTWFQNIFGEIKKLITFQRILRLQVGIVIVYLIIFDVNFVLFQIFTKELLISILLLTLFLDIIFYTLIRTADATTAQVQRTYYHWYLQCMYMSIVIHLIVLFTWVVTVLINVYRSFVL